MDAENLSAVQSGPDRMLAAVRVMQEFLPAPAAFCANPWPVHMRHERENC